MPAPSNVIEVANKAFDTASVTIAVATALMTLAVVISNIRQYFATKGVNQDVINGTEYDKPNGVIEKPFEVVALSNYYRHALFSAKVAFTFSMGFAAVGFGVIVFAFVSYNVADTTGAILKVVSGAVIEAVSGLFFVQSTNAQRSMGEFFEKLRLDRLNVEAREMIAEIEDQAMRDQLRGQMILKYSGIDRLLVGTGAGSGTAIIQ